MERGTSGTFTPYGPWATLALTGAIIFGASMAGWTLIYLAGGVADGPLSTDQTLASAVIFNLVGMAVLAKLVDLRAPGQVSSYLALRWVGRATAFRWLGIIAAFLAADWIVSDAVRAWSDTPMPPTWLDDAALGPMLLLAVVFVGPAFEELLFRGFVMEGLMPTRLGQSGALMLSTLAWTLMHSEYDLIALVSVFFTGLIFGTARLATGSLLLPVVLHMTFNMLSVLFWYV